MHGPPPCPSPEGGEGGGDAGCLCHSKCSSIQITKSLSQQHWSRRGRGFESKENQTNSSDTKNRQLFERLVFTYNAEPKVLTQYIRKAWVSDVDDYARVTFDIQLRYMHETNYNLQPNEEMMVPCDSETVFDPGCSVILELKCFTQHVPLWMIDMIRFFDLRRRGFSKYMTGLIEVLGSHGYHQATRVVSSF